MVPSRYHVDLYGRYILYPYTHRCIVLEVFKVLADGRESLTKISQNNRRERLTYKWSLHFYFRHPENFGEMVIMIAQHPTLTIGFVCLVLFHTLPKSWEITICKHIFGTFPKHRMEAEQKKSACQLPSQKLTILSWKNWAFWPSSRCAGSSAPITMAFSSEVLVLGSGPKMGPKQF